MSDLKGTVSVTYTVNHRVALSIATEGWTKAERDALRAGDPEAREALIDAVWLNGQRRGFDDVDEGFVDLRISDD